MLSDLPPKVPESIPLGIPGFEYGDLHRPERLRDLHEAFMRWLNEQDAEAFGLLTALAMNPSAPAREVSDAIVRCGPYVGGFLAKLFRVEEEVAKTRAAVEADYVVFEFKKVFVKRRVLKAQAGSAWKGTFEEARRVTEIAFEVASPNPQDDEERRVAVATLYVHALEDAAQRAPRFADAWTDELRERGRRLRERLVSDPSAVRALDDVLTVPASAASDADHGALAVRVCDAIEAWLARRRADESDPVSKWHSMSVPHKTDYDALVPLRRTREDLPNELVGLESKRRERVEPFALTDRRGSRREVAAEVDYCLYCHERGRDSCSTGLHEKNGAIKKNPLGATLHGCPLDEKISEMNLMRRSGEIIGALAAVTIDNPMAPGTGHRICNDCMKGCVYQTQEPVDIPQIETRVLVDVLELPLGLEIYSLLTRWNPLKVSRPYPLPYNGKNVLVVGLGPAGYTLCHHLVNEGFGVIGVDGLKIEPLPKELLGSSTTAPRPIRDYRELKEPLESRTLLGFGGVSEYGITVRWDKNFLTMLYLNLVRRPLFRTYGGIRFGGTLTLEDAWRLGFDHVAIAAGAGKPTYIRMKNNLIRGVRKASDFLMALQLTGAYKRESLANLQVRLPAVVIGGGLTAIDTATELLAYYVVQAERTHTRYEQLKSEIGENEARKGLDLEEQEVLDEVREHGRLLLEERARAKAEGREPRLQALLQQWGGVSLVYRRTLHDSPAYRLNHEEVAHSLQEGVRYVELMSPVEVHPDKFGAAQSITFEKMEVVDDRLRGTGKLETLPARTICIAAGTGPNVSYENEYPGTFELDDRGYFKNHRAVVASDGSVLLEPTADGSGFFTSYSDQGRLVSYYGDNHPKYAGSVVKAMASAKHGYPEVAKIFAHHVASLEAAEQPSRDAAWLEFGRRMNRELTAWVEDIQRLAPGIIEVIVRAPLAARKFQPGQFYRLQNFESQAPRANGTRMVMEGLALTGAWVDREEGLLSTIALEMGTSSRMLAMLKKGQPVLLMGPTGQPTETPPGETVLLAGGGLGNAVLFSIAKAFKANGSRVIYFAGYRTGDTLFKREEIENATDQVVWSTDSGAPIEPQRPQDRQFRGNIVQAMEAYQEGALGERLFDLSEVDRIIAIGSDKMMAAIKEARKGVLARYLKPCHKAIGSINSPMQCMLKAVCAQCLQKVVDPTTGEERVVYTCFNQDLPLDEVDFGHLAMRLRQNSAQEKVANLWLDHLLRENPVERI